MLNKSHSFILLTKSDVYGFSYFFMAKKTTKNPEILGKIITLIIIKKIRWFFKG